MEQGSNKPVGLLFAGNSLFAYANPISAVLAAFGPTFAIDGPVAEEQVAGVDVTPDADQSGSGTVESTVSYNFTVTNTGNGSDSFGLAATSTNGWTTRITDTGGAIISSTGALAADASETVVLEVDIPAGAAVGSSDGETLTATSAFDGDVFDAGSATTSVVVAPEGISVTGFVTQNGDKVIASGTSESATITGSGFDGAVVTFANGSGPTPTATVDSQDGTTIEVTVTVKSGGPPRDRFWDVVVTNSDGSSDVLAGGSEGLTVTS